MDPDRQPAGSAVIEPNTDALPRRIGARYDVMELLGRGGMAMVYRVRAHGAAHDVALKQLVQSGSSQDRQASGLFEREFYVLAQLRHPSVIEVYDYGVDTAGPYYTMELLDGGDLSMQTPLPFRTACQLMMQVCSSLSLLHSRRLVHRDISPRNVRCTRAGAAKLIDFGAMVPMGPCLFSVGTPAFMAPEVAHHLNLDARTDLFSLGATLYYALTGRRAFAARTMSELTEVWRVEPTPPSRLVAGLPAALDELIMSMLRIDPGRRPRSAFEVLQRLAACAGIEHTDSEEISRAYLSSPTLVGRDAELRRFRQCLRRAKQAEGGALLFEGGAGMGRTRLIDMCTLEGKTAGACVLRLDGSSARREPLASAQLLAEQLLHATPDTPLRELGETLRARPPSSLDPANANAAGTQQLATRAQLQADPYAAQAALCSLFRAASRQRVLLIAIDDIENLDEASLGLIVTLADAATNCQLLIVASVEQPIDESAQRALAVLRQHSVAMTLEPLSAEQTEALFASVFFDAPHAALVSDCIHRLSAGRPREAMALAQHLVDTKRVRYAEGNWILPGDLALAELPASAEDALRLRIAELSALARCMVEAQALALEDTWSRDDYLGLSAAASAVQVDDALAELLRQGVLTSQAGAYRLSRLGVANYLTWQLTAAEARHRHQALAAMSERTARPWLFEVHHRLLADDGLLALERLAPSLSNGVSATTIADGSGLTRKAVAKVFDLAYRCAVQVGRPAREINELLRMFVELSIRTDNTLFMRHAPDWVAQLERDSGFNDYHSQPTDLPAPLRLARATQQARARYDALPVSERVYSVDEAITYLVRYVTFATTIAWRAGDTRLVASLPSKLAPFASETPLAHAMWQNALAACEMMYEARLERARERYTAVYERWSDMQETLPYGELIRLATALTLSSIDIMLGLPSAKHWIEIIDESPLLKVNALFGRRMLCLFEGDLEAAEILRCQAEVLSVQAGIGQMFHVPLALELHAQVHARDLAGVKRVAQRAAKLAAEGPGWLPLHHVAQGYFQQLRGDLPAAKLAFEEALALSDPDHVDPPPMLRAWVAAVAGYIAVLTELGELEAAYKFGVVACARCEALDISDGYPQVRALALAEAKLGKYEQAAQRLDALLVRHAGRNPALLAADLEARALIAIWARDANAARHFSKLALHNERSDSTPLQLARRGRLRDEAARMGIGLALPDSGFESVVLNRTKRATTPALAAPLSAALEALRDPSTRASRALALLCTAAQTVSGHFYQVRSGRLVRSPDGAMPLEAALDEFVHGYWEQWQGQAGMTSVFTATEAASQSVERAHWFSPTGKSYTLVLLKPCARDECIGIVTLLDPAPGLVRHEFSVLVWALADRLLELNDTIAPGSNKA